MTASGASSALRLPPARLTGLDAGWAVFRGDGRRTGSAANAGPVGNPTAVWVFKARLPCARLAALPHSS